MCPCLPAVAQYSGNYGPPEGFNFENFVGGVQILVRSMRGGTGILVERVCCARSQGRSRQRYRAGGADPPAWVSDASVDPQDDPALADFNVHERVELFVNRSLTIAGFYQQGEQDILLTMGTDFTLQVSNFFFFKKKVALRKPL